ncbi:PH domain-containing protein [Actinomycetes bacterium KLBMP 9797]
MHPLTPLLRGGRALVVIIAALSWQTLGQVGLGWFAVMVLALVVGQVVLALVSWYNTGYHVVGRELRVHEGLLWRRTRAIPLERLQAVEVVRPLLAQLTGLAELRLEVVGGSKTEAPLAYLTVADAVALRARLLALAGQAPAAAAGTESAERAAAPAERPIHAVVNRELLVSQLLTPQALTIPFGVAGVTAQFVYDPTFSFIGIASTVTAMAGILLQPVRRVLADWNFRLARGDAGLRLRGGLLETRSQTIPLVRVQAVRVTWPLLWRAKGWLRMRLDVAGMTGAGVEDGKAFDRLLPVGDAATSERVLAETLPGVSLAGLPNAAPPARARWFHPFALPVMGVGLTADVMVARDGRLTRQLVIVPYARMQSVRVVQGPLQRRLGLATVYADTAGGLPAAARDRDLSEAWWLAAELVRRSREAREARDTETRETRETEARETPAGVPTTAPPVPPPGT